MSRPLQVENTCSGRPVAGIRRKLGSRVSGVLVGRGKYRSRLAFSSAGAAEDARLDLSDLLQREKSRESLARELDAVLLDCHDPESLDDAANRKNTAIDECDGAALREHDPAELDPGPAGSDQAADVRPPGRSGRALPLGGMGAVSRKERA